MREKLLLFCFLIFGLRLVAQDSEEVRLKTMPRDTNYILALNDHLFEKIRNGKYAIASEGIKELRSLSEKLDYGLGLYKAMNLEGVIAYSKQEPEKAMEYFKKCNEIIESYHLPDKIYQNSLNNIGIIYDQMGDRENATKFAAQLIDFQEKKDLKPLKTWPYAQMAQNLKFYRKYDEALSYYNKVLLIETESKDLTGVAISENNIGTVLEDIGKNKEAIAHFERGLGMAVKADYPLLQTDLLTNLGRLYLKEGKRKEAENSLLKSEKICRELDAKSSLKTVVHNLGDFYLEQKQYDKAEKYYLEGLKLARELQNTEQIYSVNEALAVLYTEMGDFKRAIDHKNEATVAKDSLFKIETAKNTEELLRKYEAEKKQQEIELLSQTNRNVSLQNRLILVGSGAFILLTGLAVYTLFNRNRLKQLQATQRLRNRIAADLHDEIGSTMSSISLISEMTGSLEIPEREKQIFARIHEDARGIIQSVDEIIWSVNPGDDSVRDISFRIRKFLLPLTEKSEIKTDFCFDEKLDHVTFSMEKRRNIYLILKEAVNNSLKYSKTESLGLFFEQVGKSLQVTVIDTGVGIDFDTANHGNGLKNMEFRAKEIGADLTIETALEKGTSVCLTVPIA